MTRPTLVFVELIFGILKVPVARVMPPVTGGMTAVRMQWRLAVLIVSCYCLYHILNFHYVNV